MHGVIYFFNKHLLSTYISSTEAITQKNEVHSYPQKLYCLVKKAYSKLTISYKVEINIKSLVGNRESN